MNAQIILQTRQASTDSRQHGVLQINIDDTNTNVHPETTFIVVVDLSGSMDDQAASSSKSNTRESKLDQLKVVLKNIVRFIANNTNHIVWFKLIGFNHNICTIIPIKIITKENIAEIISSIDEMYAYGSTDIEKALIATHDNPVIPNCHILILSDGKSTCGKSDPKELAKLVNPHATNSFLGFGLEHDPYMFNTLAATLNSSYFFIQDKEKAGVAYGEILYGALHNRYNGVVAVANNCELYDYKMGKWSNKLYIGRLASSDTKTYHIRKIDGCNDTDVHIDILSEESVAICSAQFDGSYDDLIEMTFRLRTLELLYYVAMFEREEYMESDYEVEFDDSDDSDDHDDNDNSHYNSSIQRRSMLPVGPDEDIKTPIITSNVFQTLRPNQKIVVKSYNVRLLELQNKLRKLLCEMIDYMKTINNKNFMKNLCDDIAIVLKTIGTEYCQMLTYSRQHSQGDERAHKVTNISEIEENIQRSSGSRNSNIQRASRYSCQRSSASMGNDIQRASRSSCEAHRETPRPSINPIDDIIDNYSISDNLDKTCSGTKLFVIRNISGNSDEPV